MISKTFEQMTLLITEWAEQIAGIQTKSRWEWCFRFYSSFADCPIGSNHTSADASSFIVAVVNPSLRRVNRTRIAVPSANFTAAVYNESVRNFLPVEAAVLCDYNQQTGAEDNCWLHVKHQLEGNSLGFMMVTRNDSANVDAVRMEVNGTNRIENDLQWVQYKQFDNKLGA